MFIFGDFLTHVLAVLPSEPAVNTVTVNSTAATVRISQSITGTTPITYELFHRLGSTGQDMGVTVVDVEQTQIISPLFSNAQYWVYVKATNSAGSKDSAQITVSTKQASK